MSRKEPEEIGALPLRGGIAERVENEVDEVEEEEMRGGGGPRLGAGVRQVDRGGKSGKVGWEERSSEAAGVMASGRAEVKGEPGR